MSLIHPRQWRKAGKVVMSMDCDWKEALQAGNELADEIGDVTMFAYDAQSEDHWEERGTFHGNMRYTNVWGQKMRIKEDFFTLEAVEEGGDS